MREYKKFKNPPAGKTGNFAPNPQASTPTNDKHPAFCFKHLASTHGLDKCTADEKSALVDQFATWGKMTWAQIQGAPRHGLGSETISADGLPKRPSSITADVTFLAMRFDGKKPIVGFRDGKVFFVVWIDRDFSVYKH